MNTIKKFKKFVNNVFKFFEHSEVKKFKTDEKTFVIIKLLLFLKLFFVHICNFASAERDINLYKDK